MTKRKSTKRALLLSALSLLMCVSMLIGSTFAWFTDSVTSKNNIIKSGKLDVKVSYMNEASKEWKEVTETSNVFMDKALWEPGHTEVIKFKIENIGTLALKYTLGVNIVSEDPFENVYGDTRKLSEFIYYGITNDGSYTRQSAIAAVAENATPLNVVYGSDSISLEAGKEKIVTMVVYMPETIDNQANCKAGAEAPEIQLGINVYATQYTFESDSFDKNYDKFATSDAPGVIISDDLTGPLVDDLKNNTALKNYIPENLPENTQLIIELTSVDCGVAYNVKPSSLIEDPVPVTFRLPIHENYEDDYAEVALKTQARSTNGQLYKVQGEGNGKYVELTTENFGTFVVNEIAIKGEGVTGGVDWKLYEDGTLVIAPTKGAPAPDKNAPTKRTYEVGEWRERVIYNSKGVGIDVGGSPYDVNAVRKLIIEEGVTSIGSFAAQFPNLTGEVIIPSTVTYIGQEAFQKAPMTKLTFAKVPEGQVGKELRVAHGAFKNLIIEEVALPDDRPVTLHCWAFLMCTNLKSITIPATIGDLHGCDEIDYESSPSVSANPSWTKISQIVGGYNNKGAASNPNMETIIFANEAARNKFYSYSDNKLGNTGAVASVLSGTSEVIIDCATIEIAVSLAQSGDTIVLMKNSSETVTIPNGVALELNGYTADNVIFG